MNNRAPYRSDQTGEYDEKVIQVSRVSKKTKGGNRIGFSILVVVGDKKGKVGVALAKAADVKGAIGKAFTRARANMITVPLRGTTVPFEVTQKFSAARVLVKPAPPGSGIIAGGPMRTVLDAAGIRDAVGKILGTKNKTSNVYATIEALKTISAVEKKKGK